MKTPASVSENFIKPDFSIFIKAASGNFAPHLPCAIIKNISPNVLKYFEVFFKDIFEK